MHLRLGRRVIREGAKGPAERAGNGRLRRAASYTFGIVYRLGALTENRLAYGIMNYNLGTP